ncbi:MAG TPA: ADYC domain-containing protein [Aggregicoccus sp.]|nr:ADYC domain-containing protein [Aggregicoccus sp.]
MTKTRMTWAVMAALVSGCGLSEQDPRVAVVASTQQALLQENGRELNGRELNGRELNGRELNGRELNGRELNGRELNGSSLGGATAEGLTALWLEGSELVALTEAGVQVRGAALTGAELASEGSPLRYRLEGVEAVGDVWHYQVSYESGGQWLPVCEEGASSIPLAGLWDYRQGVEGGGSRVDVPGVFTFACTDAALGKCVQMGYAPWRAAAGGGSLAAHHQACTRMLRADYFGDGRSFTKDGITINVYDGVGIQEDTESWRFEAEWDEQGALCLEGRRRSSSRWLAREDAYALQVEDVSCGDRAHFDEGTLLMTEYRAR